MTAMNTNPYGATAAPNGAAFAGTFGYTPMMGGYGGPDMRGPLNVFQGNPVLQVGAQALLSGVYGEGRVPTQFFPQQNVYDQFIAQRAFQQHQVAMQMARHRDQTSYSQTLGGVTQLFTGQPLTDTQRARNNQIAGMMGQFAPIAMQLMGPDLFDQLHGSRGSSVVFANTLSQAMHTGIDPVTGRLSYSGRSSGVVTDAVYNQLFGPNANPLAMRGMSQGQAGMVIQEMQMRGLLGRPIGTMSLTEQRASIGDIDDATLDNIAQRMIERELEPGETPSERRIEQARNRVRETYRTLTDPTAEVADLGELPGGEDIIRAADAQRITGKLKNMSGAVRAMRDIFGDMGRPDAPMREIINGLEALTQGGLATMSPADLEMTVRRTHALARNTGIGMQGMIALTAQSAGYIRQNLPDLDQSFALRVTQQSAAFAAGLRNSGTLSNPMFGRMNTEEAMMMDQRLRAHAANSPFANQAGALMRMRDRGMLGDIAGTEVGAIISAIERGDTEYEFEGAKRNVGIPRQQMIQMLQRDAGLSRSEAQAVMFDRFGNQEFIQQYDIEDLTRRQQRVELINKTIGGGMSLTVGGFMRDRGVADYLTEQGIVSNRADFSSFAREISTAVGRDFMDMDAETRADPEKRKQAMAQSLRRSLRARIKARNPEASDAAIDRQVNQAMEMMGGEQGMARFSVAAYSQLNRIARRLNMESAENMAMLNDPEVMKLQKQEMWRAEADADIRSALGGLGQASPLARVVDALKEADGDTNIKDILGKVLGGIDRAEIEKLMPGRNDAERKEMLDSVLGIAEDSANLDTTKQENRDLIKQNANTIRGILMGGDEAKKQIERLKRYQKESPKAARRNNVADRIQQLQEASKDRTGGAYKRLGEYFEENMDKLPEETREIMEKEKIANDMKNQAQKVQRGEIGQGGTQELKTKLTGTLKLLEDNRVAIVGDGVSHLIDDLNNTQGVDV